VFQVRTADSPTTIELLLREISQSGAGGSFDTVTVSEQVMVWPLVPVAVPVKVVFELIAPVPTDPPETGVTEPIP